MLKIVSVLEGYHIVKYVRGGIYIEQNIFGIHFLTKYFVQLKFKISPSLHQGIYVIMSPTLIYFLHAFFFSHAIFLSGLHRDTHMLDLLLLPMIILDPPLVGRGI